jgi:hypothetical protein
MESEGLLSCSQGSTIVPYPKPDESNPQSPAMFNNHVNVVLPSTSGFLKWYLPFSCSSVPIKDAFGTFVFQTDAIFVLFVPV